MSKEVLGPEQASASPYRTAFTELGFDRWIPDYEDYLRGVYGDSTADSYAARREKEHELAVSGQLQEYLAIKHDGFSEATADEILKLSDEHQVEISQAVSRLKKLMAITYPSQAGRWLEAEVTVLRGQSPLDIILGDDKEAKVRFNTAMTILEKCLSDDSLPYQSRRDLVDFFDLPKGSLNR